MARIEVELKVLHQILADRDYFYQVPDYQRPYVWDKDHLGVLMDDLVGSYTNNREDQYFCGSIVIAKNQKDERWDVVDGQQRLTSFIILACTILRLYKASLGQKSKAFIEESIYDRFDKDKNRLRFLTAQNYNHIFENEVLKNLEFEDNLKKSELHKKFEENTYWRNAYYFKELLDESIKNGSISDIDDFVEWFYEHIAFLTSQEKPLSVLEKSQLEKEKKLESERLAKEQKERLQKIKDKEQAELKHKIREQKNATLGKSELDRQIAKSDNIPYKELENAPKSSVSLNDDEIHPLKFVIVNKSDLKPNFNNTGTQTRTAIDSKKIEEIANNFDPKLILGRGGFDDLPIILHDGQVIAGNHRTQGMLNFNARSRKENTNKR
ncbi:DUF262 domain-containing protein [Helicobacter pylori]|uniref:GmrSD restriction endonuclease domain-containing protein n=1 Tax=Helicobacter pylori TaxID=210 RepID=UPI000ACCF72C|nr:DUF262 domain-containing protein [Helicobacter pylori]